MKLIHLTDTHLLGSSERLFNINVEERLELAVESINRNHEDAAFCVITGDITHLGEEKAFEKFSSIARHLCIPWYPILGNHDLRANFAEAFAEMGVEPGAELTAADLEGIGVEGGPQVAIECGLIERVE